jgi:hypothetical protein
MEGFEESQLYYTTPQTNNQAENAGNAKELLTEHPPTSCPEPAGQGETASCCGVAKRLNYVRAGLDFSRKRC